MAYGNTYRHLVKPSALRTTGGGIGSLPAAEMRPAPEWFDAGGAVKAELLQYRKLSFAAVKGDMAALAFFLSFFLWFTDSLVQQWNGRVSWQ